MVEHAISLGSLEKKGDGNRDGRDSRDMGVGAAMRKVPERKAGRRRIEICMFDN
jgi:hypothetical protein